MNLVTYFTGKKIQESNFHLDDNSGGSNMVILKVCVFRVTQILSLLYSCSKTLN